MAPSASAPQGAPRPTVLVVDDDADIRLALELLLDVEGFAVWTAKGGREALARLDQEASGGRRPDVLMTDVKMPGMDGIELLDAVVQRPDAPAVVMISGHGDVAMAVDAVKRGAVDFLEKPLDQNRVLVSVRGALRQGQLTRENRALKRRLATPWAWVGEGRAWARIDGEVERLAQVDAPVLITGENGTGKEVVARRLHALGPRAAGPFVAVNCAAIPEELIESELFGHERGSFTGAAERRVGHFEAASTGTLFLDEIGDMPLAAQAKVLRALESHEVTRVGGSSPIAVDLRVVAATNADLVEATEQKRFRLDLFYRLSVVPLHIPPLRERREDVPSLARHFLERLAERAGRAVPGLEPAALELLMGLDYPGNVRQLRNLLEGAWVFADGPAIARADLERLLENGPALRWRAPDGAPAGSTSLAASGDVFAAPTFEEFKDLSEAEFLRRKIAENEGNVKRTAERLGMQRSHLYKKIDRYGLRG